MVMLTLQSSTALHSRSGLVTVALLPDLRHLWVVLQWTYVARLSFDHLHQRCWALIFLNRAETPLQLQVSNVYIDSAEGDMGIKKWNQKRTSYMKDDNTPPTPCLHE